MKKIINPWIGKEHYDCFGCSPNNPIGLHLEFFEDGDDIVSKWHPETHYQGWIDTMHGGILSTLIDETCGWVVSRKRQCSGFTTQMNIKFRKAVSTKENILTIRARIIEQRRNLLFISAELLNTAGELCVEGNVTYFMLGEEKSKEMGFEYCAVEGELETKD